MWLNILQDCGVDLNEYGKERKRCMDEEGSKRDFEIYRDWVFEVLDCEADNALLEVRLINFTYGNEPEDWKLWWSEPTDELVGDFWRQMEPEPLRIPGGWDED